MSEHLPAKSNLLPVAVDAMGGDFGLEGAVKGAVLAARELGIPVILVGEESNIHACLATLGANSDSRISVCHSSEVVTMEETPAISIRRKPNSSINVAFGLVKDKKASCVVSAGNTGAVMVAGLLVAGTLPGIVRPAIASLIPQAKSNKPAVFLDSGANTDCHAFQLVQFALMGHYYAASVMGWDSPRIALLSNGSESSKGTDIIRSAALILNEISALNFTGYIEGNDISRSLADVIVCDGFTGNVLLKTVEGSVDLVFETINEYMKKNSRGKFGLWLAKPLFKSIFREKLDPSTYGGAPLLGLNEVAVVCHGAANSKSIMNAIRVAQKFVEDGVVPRMAAALSELDIEMPGGYEDGIWDRMGKRFEKDKQQKKPSKASVENEI